MLQIQLATRCCMLHGCARWQPQSFPPPQPWAAYPARVNMTGTVIISVLSICTWIENSPVAKLSMVPTHLQALQAGGHGQCKATPPQQDGPCGRRAPCYSCLHLQPWPSAPQRSFVLPVALRSGMRCAPVVMCKDKRHQCGLLQSKCLGQPRNSFSPRSTTTCPLQLSQWERHIKGIVMAILSLHRYSTRNWVTSCDMRMEMSHVSIDHVWQNKDMHNNGSPQIMQACATTERVQILFLAQILQPLRADSYQTADCPGKLNALASRGFFDWHIRGTALHA